LKILNSKIMAEGSPERKGWGSSMIKYGKNKINFLKAKKDGMKYKLSPNVHKRYPPIAKKKETPDAETISIKLKDLKRAQPHDAPIQRGCHIAFRMETAPDEKEGIDDAHFWNHAIVLEVCDGKIKLITFCSSLMDIDESKRPLPRDFMFESDCIKVGSSGLLLADRKLTLQYAEVSINHLQSMFRYENESDATANEVVERAEAMVANPTEEWDYEKFTSEEFAMRAVTGKEDFTREEVKTMQLVKSVGKQNFSIAVQVLIPDFAKLVLDIGAPLIVKKIVMRVISVTCREGIDEIAQSLMKMSTQFAAKLAPKMAAACGAIAGGIGATVGIALEVGFFTYKMIRAVCRKRRKLWSNAQFWRFIIKEVVGFMTSTAGVITSSVVCSIIGLVIGGLPGTAAGFAVGAGFSGIFCLVKLILKYGTGKLYDKLCSDDRMPITYSEVKKAVEEADRDDLETSEMCSEDSRDFVSAMHEIINNDVIEQ
jgi:hypothetical protein